MNAKIPIELPGERTTRGSRARGTLFWLVGFAGTAVACGGATASPAPTDTGLLPTVTISSGGAPSGAPSASIGGAPAVGGTGSPVGPNPGGTTPAPGMGSGGGFGNTGNASGVGNTGNAPGVGSTGNTGSTSGIGNVGGSGNTGGVLPAQGGAPNGGAGGQSNSGSVGGAVAPSAGCEGETMPPVTGDYSANGPMATTVVNNTGADGMFTIYRPTTLGANGFKHPVATWGNGITTNPSFYPGLLGAIASHGFVVVASNSSSVTTQLMTDGLDWMLAQNAAAGDYQGKLNTTCLVSIGYSLGGGAAVGAGAHANIVATASMHGVTGLSGALHSPLLLLTAETDTFVVPATFVTPTFTASAVQTFYGTLGKAADTSNEGHLIPVDGALSLIEPAGPNMAERAAMVAWLRLWVYSDSGAKKYFYGDDCILCKDPWVMPQRKNWK